MGIFDDAKSIIIGDKEVASIVVDGGTIYEKPVPVPTSFDIKFTAWDVTQSPISGVSVSVADKTGTTNEDGECTITGVDEGTYTATYSKDGYDTATDEITVDSDHTNFFIDIHPSQQQEL